MQFVTLACTQPSQDSFGYIRPLPFAKVYVWTADTTSTVQLYDIAGNPITNPAMADVNGFAKFAAPDGTYDIQIADNTGAAISPLIQHVIFYDAANNTAIAGLTALATTGFVSRTGASGPNSTFAARSIAGTAGKVVVANGDGIAGNPTISIAAGAVGNTELAAGAAEANIGHTTEDVANKDTDATMAANSDARYASQKATKTAIAAAQAAAQAAALAGNFTGSIRGVAISTDTLLQGQGYVYDAISNSLKARSNEGLNQIINGAFDIWQENTSYSLSNSASKMFLADGWKAGTAGPGRTVSRVAGIANSRYALKIQRAVGNASAPKVILAQQLSTEESMFLAGRTVTVSFDYLIGADYSPTSGPFVNLLVGTGTDEDVDLHVGTPNFVTGGATISGGNLVAQVAAAGTVVRVVSPPLVITAGTTEICLCIIVGNFSAVAAGNNDFAIIGGVKIEIGNVATHFRKEEVGDTLAQCQRRYWKTFAMGTVPAQNVGANTGEVQFPAVKAGANAQSLGTVRFNRPMRAAPTITFFNPAAANAQARDLTAPGDCSATTASNVGDSSCVVTTTGNSSTAVANTVAVHIVADARL
jgi:hypothetical protein